ncbi:MAG: methylase involved in ubiquinone/menaquinone biosynthesis [Planctomycetota bacterium]|nr:methylase involved in ubiquinone/menaquinone biosynthesis [Planctomycetota bacterium]
MSSSVQVASSSINRTNLDERVCPKCHSSLDVVSSSIVCGHCGHSFLTIAGIPDLRLFPDRYLSMNAERAKADRLAAIAGDGDLSSLSSAYYAMTEDVDALRRRRFQAHILAAEDRGEALADRLQRDEHVLEVGCGTGGLLLAARRRGIRIQGVDIGLRWLVFGRKRLAEGSRTSLGDDQIPDDILTAANAEALPWPDSSFDCVVADSVLEHLEDPLASLAEWRRVVRPGGRLLLWSPNRFSLLSDPHVGLWGVGWLPRSLQATYVRSRRGCRWPVQLRSALEAARMIQSSGWTVHNVQAAPVPGPSRGRTLLRLYDRVRCLPILGETLREFGPLWQIVARREGRS